MIGIARTRPAHPVRRRVFIPVDVDRQRKNRQLAHHDILYAGDSLLLSIGITGPLILRDQLISLGGIPMTARRVPALEIGADDRLSRRGRISAAQHRLVGAVRSGTAIRPTNSSVITASRDAAVVRRVAAL